MKELITKTLLTGVGLAALTKDKVEEVAREIANAAQLSSEKGQAFVDEAVARADKTRTDLEAAVQRMVNENLKKTDLATKSDIDRLSARLEKLEQMLAAKSD